MWLVSYHRAGPGQSQAPIAPPGRGMTQAEKSLGIRIEICLVRHGRLAARPPSEGVLGRCRRTGAMVRAAREGPPRRAPRGGVRLASWEGTYPGGLVGRSVSTSKSHLGTGVQGRGGRARCVCRSQATGGLGEHHHSSAPWASRVRIPVFSGGREMSPWLREGEAPGRTCAMSRVCTGLDPRGREAF